jgi:hypothetical protein
MGDLLSSLASMCRKGDAAKSHVLKSATRQLASFLCVSQDVAMNVNANDSASPGNAPPAKAPRSPVERTLVWGGIAVLLAVLLIELRAQQGYSHTLQALSTHLDSDDADMPLAEAKSLLALSPALSAPVPVAGTDEIKCSWFSLFKKGQYEITLIISREKEPVLLSYTTPAPPEDPEESIAAASSTSPADVQAGMAMGGPGMGGGGMGMGMGGMGGPPRPNPLRDAIDTNGDGDLSAEEIAAAPTSLGKVDKDSDGLIVAGELAPPPAEGAPDTAGPAGGPGGGGRRGPGRLLAAIDTNTDGTISADERAAAVEGLKKLDADSDGKIVRDELRPPGGFGGSGPAGGGTGGGTGGGSERRRRPDAEEVAPVPATPAQPEAESAPAAPAPTTEKAP